jgi:DNA modification methylase
MLENTRKRNRGGRTGAGNIFECFRINLGSVVMFKATTAKYIYKKYNATSVLDPTAGWGGRMLGAWALDINYTGIDTNTEMVQSYDDMISFLNNDANEFGHGLFSESSESKLKMIWQSCLDVDFSKLDYDFVLTSPPYVNLEIYEHMPLWDSDTIFYKEFFIPLWQKCLDHIKPGGHVCFNISPKMYDAAVANGLPVCDIEEDLLQQMGQQKAKKKQDKIYIWKKPKG